MNVVLLGPPGSGKGTQAQFISERFDIPQISTGDMLRTAISEGTELGKRAKVIMDSGNLVSDDVILGIVDTRLMQPDCAKGVLFDGFPRTIAQAEGLLEIGTSIDFVVELEVPDEEVVKRISGRRVHEPSGRVYHIVFNPPNEENKDDITGEPLLQRPDDAESTVYERLAVYQRQTAPLIEFYQRSSSNYVKIQGVGTVDSIFNSIESALTLTS